MRTVHAWYELVKLPTVISAQSPRSMKGLLVHYKVATTNYGSKDLFACNVCGDKAIIHHLYSYMYIYVYILY